MTLSARYQFALLACLTFCLADAAQAQDHVLNVGDAAPVFEAPTVDGEAWRSKDHVGKGLIVVYFYPAAMTGGCTKQACAFRDDRTRLKEMGAEVIGVSGDPVANLQVFKRAHRLNFPLLSDADGHVARAFGVPVSGGSTITSTVAGEEVKLTRDVTTARWTFIIGPDGKIVYKNTEVDAAGDSKAVIAALEQLNKQ